MKNPPMVQPDEQDGGGFSELIFTRGYGGCAVSARDGVPVGFIGPNY